MKQFIFFIGILSAGFIAAAQPCVVITAPQFSENTRKDFEQKLATAKTDYEKDTNNADAIIWYGRRTAYLGNYMQAIDIFTKGISLHPGDARLYRHRGHRYITVRCFDKAIIDFKKASQLIKGKPDEVEPDGLPNAKNIPTGTLQSNIWYHLGLAYFIKGKYKKALKAYNECLNISKNDDMYVATANWLYLTLRKLNKTNEAATLLATVNDKMEIIENNDYLEILLLYKNETGITDPVQFLQKEKQGLGLSSFGYGLGNYLLLKGKPDMARKIFQLIIESNQWSSFGFIAAEAELARMK